MGAVDYTIATMQQLKKDLMDLGATDHEITWAIGGVVSTMTATLLQTSNDVFVEALQAHDNDMRTEILEIQKRFNAFVDKMVTAE